MVYQAFLVVLLYKLVQLLFLILLLYESLLSVGRVNFDTETALVRRYNIHALPTLLLFINGAVAGFLIDPSSEKEIDAFLRKMLGLNAGGLYGKYV